MREYKVIYGLGGGFNTRHEEIYECEDEEEAQELGYDCAMEEYGMYAGSHGLRDIDMIMEQDNCNEDEAGEIYDEEASSWIYYEVEKQ